MRGPRPPSPIALLGLLALTGCATAPTGRATVAPFISDGCSLFPDGTPAHPELWCDCCLRHDVAYWQGGSDDDRLAADRALRACVEARTDDPALARLVYVGVRAGGSSVFPTGFRWGYGWPFGRSNQPLTPQERAQVEEQLQAYLAGNPDLRCTGERWRGPAAPSIRPLRPPAAPPPRLAHARALACPTAAKRGAL